MSGTTARAELVVITIDGSTYADVGVPGRTIPCRPSIVGAEEAMEANGWTVDGRWSHGGSTPDGWSATATIRKAGPCPA